MHATKRVYIVDDEASVRVSISSLVRSSGFDASTFESGETLLALGVSEISRADCIICDVNMPGINGIDLQALLYKSGCRVPFIFCTAHFTDDMRAAALAGGALCVLEKPVDPDVLCKWLDRAFDDTAPHSE
jgi:FixJ family two-component response regulator